jgi:hypothetical protein
MKYAALAEAVQRRFETFFIGMNGDLAEMD